ncbi:thioredoxin domain-containing protein [Thiomicrorhabdus sp.]|uniref:thioredoxin domain-containing protein n=1 Tax=Thiomicrorhabdus sp. TaxID=2039724 RepID=UPI003564C485
MFSLQTPCLKFPFLRLFSITLLTVCVQAKAIETKIDPVNTLSNHPSPYLAMHAEDPVHWQPWNTLTLRHAQQDNRPLLISSGYFACHWCHVMQKENYQDPDAAEIMNRFFVPVKIDRELNPDLDNYLIDFSRRVTGKAGWPQHVVLTPKGYPFAAFGYLPNTNYKRTLIDLSELWKTQSKRIRSLAETTSTKQTASKSISLQEFRSLLLQHLDQSLDDLSGGLKGSHKFPQMPLILSLLEQNSLSETQQAWLELTFDQMQSQHLIDHINGGFYRYTVDPEWQTPHFEKMGYDNALLAKAYFVAGHKFHNNRYLKTAEDTLHYMEKHLYSPKLGLFKSSQSALDKQGREGGNYLFNRKQLRQKLSTTAFKEAEHLWRLDQPAPYELGWHPSPTMEHWAEIKTTLQATVTDIPSDDKYILGWNGLTLSAYVSAYEAVGQKDYLIKAQQLANRLIDLLNQPEPPKALTGDAKYIGHASLEDYAYVIQGLQSLQRVAPDNTLQEGIQALTESTLRRFLNKQGWQTSTDFLLPGQNRFIALKDTATPSPSALLECSTDDRGEKRNAGFADLLRQNPLDFASYLIALECQTD